MRSGSRATWAAGGIGVRTCSTGRRCRRPRVSPGSRSPVLLPYRSSRRASELPERYPGYDVLAKRDSPSWNEQTRRVIDERLALDPGRHTFFTDAEWPTVRAVCARVLAQESGNAGEVPLAAMLDERLAKDARDGYRDSRLPAPREAWRRAVLALDAESVVRHSCRFHELKPGPQADLL